MRCDNHDNVFVIDTLHFVLYLLHTYTRTNEVTNIGCFESMRLKRRGFSNFIHQYYIILSVTYSVNQSRKHSLIKGMKSLIEIITCR